MQTYKVQVQKGISTSGNDQKNPCGATFKTDERAVVITMLSDDLPFKDKQMLQLLHVYKIQSTIPDKLNIDPSILLQNLSALHQ